MSGQVEIPKRAIDEYDNRVEVGMRGKMPFILHLDGLVGFSDDLDFMFGEILKALAELRKSDELLSAASLDRARVVWIHIRNKMIADGHTFPAKVNSRRIMTFLARATAR